MDHFVTIIIPVYRDWHRLELCLKALADQTYPKEKFEVIIVNNDQADAIPSNLSLQENFQIISESQPGSYAARNAGLRIAKGDIIGFTDSDCIPDKNWIKNAVDYFDKNKTCSRIAGKISIFPKNQKATTAEKYDRLYSFRQKEYVSKYGTCVTGNLFAYKFVFDNVGFFNEKQMSFGDFDWGVKAHEANYLIDYVENVVINHPARDLEELVKKEKRLAGGKEKGNKEKQSILSIYLRFLKDVRPRVRGTYKFIKNNGAYLKQSEIFSILLLRLLLNYIRAQETMRLRFGKRPNRV